MLENCNIYFILYFCCTPSRVSDNCCLDKLSPLWFVDFIQYGDAEDDVAEQDSMGLDALIACVSKIERLENRIRGGAPAAKRLLSQDALLRTVAAIGMEFARVVAERPTTRLNLLADMEASVEVGSGFRTGLELLPRQAALLRANEYFFEFLADHSGLHSDAYRAVESLKVCFATLWLSNPQSLFSSNSAARQFLELALSMVRLYDEHAGSRGKGLIVELTALHRGVAGGGDFSNETCQSGKRQLAALIRRYNKNALIFESHIIEKERSELLREDARLSVNAHITAAVSGRVLPKVLLEFLREVWSKHLYITYLREGMDCTAWHEGVADIDTLVWSLCVRDSKKLFDAYGGSVSKTMARMRTNAAAVYQDTQLSERFFQCADSIHLQVMDGCQPEIPEPVRVESPADSIVDPPADLSGDSLDELRVGDWYRVVDKGIRRRCKLIEKNSERQYLLFANFSGLKTGKYSLARATEGLKDGWIQPMGREGAFDRALSFAVQSLSDEIPALESAATEAENERMAALESRRQAVERERERLREEAVRQEAKRTLAEQLRLAEVRAKEQATERARALSQEREQAKARVLADVQRLQAGGILELIGDDGQQVTAKLGLKLKSSGKMIFVDRFGAKLAEFLPGQLVERILEGSAAVVNYGVAFDDTLQSLIIDRSDKLHTE